MMEPPLHLTPLLLSLFLALMSVSTVVLLQEQIKHQAQGEAGLHKEEMASESEHQKLWGEKTIMGT